MDCTGGSRCKIIFCIMQPQVQVGNMLTAAPMRLHVRKVDSFKLLSLNTMILPPVISATDPNSRAKKLAAKFIAENYDIICLQEVMYTPARQVLFDALQHEYPYATTRTSSKLTINLGTHDQAGLLRVGKDSGVLVASKFPLLRTEFRLFPSSGYGTDKMVQKGILACKVDLSSISPNKSLWIFSTHLQSNPDGGLVWRLHGDAVKKTRDARLKQMELINSFMSECIRSDEADRRRPEDVGIVLCGDFNITGEQGTLNNSLCT
jgi:endonuclease/exonuclease/phosphatase family metal-dependent hydrolase